MHLCKTEGCGRSIPKEWTLCGECVELRNKVYMLQGMGGVGERKEISKRHTLLTKLAGMREHATIAAEPNASPEDDKARALFHLLERKRILIAKALERDLTHASTAPALKDWWDNPDD